MIRGGGPKWTSTTFYLYQYNIDEGIIYLWRPHGVGEGRNNRPKMWTDVNDIGTSTTFSKNVKTMAKWKCEVLSGEKCVINSFGKALCEGHRGSPSGYILTAMFPWGICFVVVHLPLPVGFSCIPLASGMHFSRNWSIFCMK